MRIWKIISVLLIVINFCYLTDADLWAVEGSGCDSLDCQNDATCEVDNNENIYCACTGRWGGIFCNESVICNQTDPCNGGICTNGDSTENDFICDCTGTGKDGTTCNIDICEEKVILLGNGEYALFQSTLAGYQSSSNITCINGSFDGLPVASVVCEVGGNWSEPQTINCSASLESLTTEDQLTTITVITSNASKVDASVVADVVGVMSDITVVDTAQADSLMTTTNNLLRTKSADGRAEIQNSASTFLDAWKGYAEDIIRDDMLYENTETEFALIVPSPGGTAPFGILSTISAMMSPRAASTHSFSQSEALWPEDKFAGTSFQYGPNTSTSAALYATVHSDDRVFFEAFHDSGLLFDSANVESVVMSVQTSAATANFEKLEMKFYLFNYYPGLESAEQAPGAMQGRSLFCSIWDVNEKMWRENDQCSIQNVTNVDLYNYVTCSCSQPGYFAVTARVVEPPTDPVVTPGATPGLSDGEIAGIVIGSIAGVALIVGLIVYFIKKKKSKKVSSSKMSGFQHSSSEEDMELNDKKSYSSANKL